ncbi:hypothetical protein KR074_008854 [Drosophila pseudoananassae]|nr:hypothetical protein KR074_008854 [Drosophila pseudoananassae]
MNPTPVGIGFGFGRKPPNKARMRSRWRPLCGSVAATTLPLAGGDSPAANTDTLTQLTHKINNNTSHPEQLQNDKNDDEISRSRSSRAVHPQKSNYHPQNHRLRGQVTTLAMLLVALVALNNLESLLAVRTEGPRNRHGPPGEFFFLFNII